MCLYICLYVCEREREIIYSEIIESDKVSNSREIVRKMFLRD